MRLPFWIPKEIQLILQYPHENSSQREEPSWNSSRFSANWAIPSREIINYWLIEQKNYKFKDKYPTLTLELGSLTSVTSISAGSLSSFSTFFVFEAVAEDEAERWVGGGLKNECWRG